ncbi:uncharacterized protein METZ01_LOCUS377706 [marine metagenome]|uniref:Uncharacterized protein n=1 Tax=marine metagenome TaxID=408172 RepID=A0A382TSZ8_9ZZZZ
MLIDRPSYSEGCGATLAEVSVLATGASYHHSAERRQHQDRSKERLLS